MTRFIPRPVGLTLAVACVLTMAIAARTCSGVDQRGQQVGRALSETSPTGSTDEGHLAPEAPAAAVSSRPLRERALRVELDPAAITLEVSGAEPATVNVRSSLGVPLECVEFRSGEGLGWTVANEAEIPHTASRVRAVGHLEVDVPRDATEIILEPDALLRVWFLGRDARAIVESVSGIETELWPPLDDRLVGNGRDAAHVATAALADEATLAFLSAPDRTSPDRRTFEVTSTVRFHSGVELLVQWTPRSGARFELAVDLSLGEVRADSAALQILEIGPTEDPTVIRHASLRRREVSDESSARRHWSNKDASASVRSVGFIWRWSAAGLVTIPELPLDLEYVLVLERDDGWCARTTFEHTGPAQPIAMEPVARILARVVDVLGAPIATARAWLQFRDVSDVHRDAFLWQNPKPTEAADDGVFMAPKGLRLVDPNQLVTREMPRVCRLVFEAPGFENRELECPLDPGVEHDLGDIVLTTATPDLRVLFEGPLPDPWEVTWEAEPSLGRTENRIVRILATRQGSILELGFTEGREGDGPSAGTTVYLFANVDGHDSAIYRARPRGDLYVADPMVTLQCEVDFSALDPPPYFVRVVANQGSISLQLVGSFQRDVLGARHRVDVILPATEIELGWCERRLPGDPFSPIRPLAWPGPGEILRPTR